MKRRRFLSALGGATLGPTIVRAAGCRAPAANDGTGTTRATGTGFQGWAWVHGDAERTFDEWRERFARLRGGGLGAVLVSGGDTGVLADAAHDVGLAFHRWLWILNRNGDSWVKENHAEWFSVSRSGDSTLVKPPYVDYYRWLCPTREPVREYLRGVVAEVARDTRVDGVHLDYIRHPDVILPVGLWAKYGLVQDREYPEYDFCYCDVCRSTFAARSGTDPLELPDPTTDEAWRQFRWDSVTEVVRVLADEVHGHGKPITAAVFPTPRLARKLVRQAWDTWSLDGVFPMLYHRFYEEPVSWIGDAAGEGVEALAGRLPLHAGLYLPDLDPAAMTEAITYARDAGASGFALFELNGITDAHLARIAETMNAQ